MYPKYSWEIFYWLVFADTSSYPVTYSCGIGGLFFMCVCVLTCLVLREGLGEGEQKYHWRRNNKKQKNAKSPPLPKHHNWKRTNHPTKPNKKNLNQPPTKITTQTHKKKACTKIHTWPITCALFWQPGDISLLDWWLAALEDNPGWLRSCLGGMSRAGYSLPSPQQFDKSLEPWNTPLFTN